MTLQSDKPTVRDLDSDLFAIQQSIRRSFSKSQLETWMTPQPQKVYLDLSLSWMGILAAFVAVALVKTWWIGVVAFFVIGFCQYALFILGHDALHASLHRDRNVNDRLAKWLIYGPMFMGIEDGRRNHLEHHRHLGTELDPDRYLHSFSNKNSKAKFLWFCSGLSTFGKTVLKVTPLGKILHQDAIASPETSQRAAQSEKTRTSTIKILIDYFKQRIPVFVFQTLLLGLIISLGLPWWAYLLLWISPIYFCVFLPDEIRAFCDHAVLMLPDNRSDIHRLVTFRPSRLEAMIFSPHNMNYHAEHHLLPAVPYYNLPKVHQFTKHRTELTVRKSYLIFLFQVLGKLPLAVDKESTSQIGET
jgi:fatty acid desaturase